MIDPNPAKSVVCEPCTTSSHEKTYMGMRYRYGMEEEFHNREECCDNCGRWLSEDEWVMDTQSHSAWGARMSERIPRGYECFGCGDYKRF